MSRAISFSCKRCGATFLLQARPKFCPYCGAEELTSQSIETAKRLIDECNAMIPEIETAWDQYIQLAAQYEMRTQKLAQYEKRGFITRDMVPKYHKTKLSEALKVARSNARR
jgi:hypothetical protein